MAEVTDDLIKIIKEECERQGISLSKLLSKADVSSHVVSFWETGEVEPSLKVLDRLCEALGIKLEDLFKNTPPRLTDTQTEILTEWRNLNERQRVAVTDYINAMKYAKNINRKDKSKK